MRTLIVCFVLLILALVPLRFVEVGNSIVESQTKVLGEETTMEIIQGETEDEIVEVVDNEVVLPNADVSVEIVGEGN